MSVFDPFAGYGTVGTVARLYGMDYELWDLNPLLGHLQAAATMESPLVEPDALTREMAACIQTFVPDWPNVGYWFPQEFMPMLSKAWGFYHSLAEEGIKNVLLIPLLKATRYFSYNDEGRQKLSRSPLAQKRISALLGREWRGLFSEMVRKGLHELLQKKEQYRGLGPKPVETSIRAGVDTLLLDLDREHDILITSPPYLQAQEYIRAAKMNLFWLGYPKELIRELGKKELPYCQVPACSIHSPTYLEHLQQIEEAHIRQVFERYFQGVLGALSRHQERIGRYLLLFVGPASVRGKPVPIGRIFAEHFGALGWRHEATLVDTIASRTMFLYNANPATGLQDQRMRTEHLIVLSRK